VKNNEASFLFLARLSVSLPSRTNFKIKDKMENNQPQLNEHNKTEHPPMHSGESDSLPIRQK
jgi:hypothetical protein